MEYMLAGPLDLPLDESGSYGLHVQALDGIAGEVAAQWALAWKASASREPVSPGQHERRWNVRKQLVGNRRAWHEFQRQRCPRHELPRKRGRGILLRQRRWRRRRRAISNRTRRRRLQSELFRCAWTKRRYRSASAGRGRSAISEMRGPGKLRRRHGRTRRQRAQGRRARQNIHRRRSLRIVQRSAERTGYQGQRHPWHGAWAFAECVGGTVCGKVRRRRYDLRPSLGRRPARRLAVVVALRPDCAGRRAR